MYGIVTPPTRFLTVPMLLLDRDGKPCGGPHGEPRSIHWPTTRRHHLLWEPVCQFCGSDENPEVHHCEPFHLKPEDELNDGIILPNGQHKRGNLITLCEAKGRCHFDKGHRRNWRDFNPNIVAECLAAQASRRKTYSFPSPVRATAVFTITREPIADSGYLQIHAPEIYISSGNVKVSAPQTLRCMAPKVTAVPRRTLRMNTDLPTIHGNVAALLADYAKVKADKAVVEKTLSDVLASRVTEKSAADTALESQRQLMQAQIDGLKTQVQDLTALSSDERSELISINGAILAAGVPGVATDSSDQQAGPTGQTGPVGDTGNTVIPPVSPPADESGH